MKPRNKFQERVFALSKKLPPISETQKKWAYQHCIEHKGRRTRKGVISCLECGHQWTDKTTSGHCVCPHCHTKLKIEDTKNDTYRLVFIDNGSGMDEETVQKVIDPFFTTRTKPRQERKHDIFVRRLFSGG